MVKDLRTFPMLAELKDGELEKLSGLMREEIFPAGSRLMDEIGGAFGLILGMTGSCGLILLFSIVSAVSAVASP